MWARLHQPARGKLSNRLSDGRAGYLEPPGEFGFVEDRARSETPADDFVSQLQAKRLSKRSPVTSARLTG
jgi:hypothetical protein